MTQAKRRKGYGAKLDDLDLLLAVGPERDVQVQTIPPEATRVDTGQSPEDFVSEFGQTFSRARFAGGEGLGFAHREESEPDRFWTSDGINVALPDPGERHGVRLLRQVEGIAEINDVGYTPMATDGSSLWVKLEAGSGDNELFRSDDPLSSTPSFTADDPTGGSEPVDDIAIIASEVYAAVDTIYRKKGGSWSGWSDLTAERVWAEKRRIIAATSDRELYEARDGANSVLLLTLNEGAEWTDVTDAGSHILAVADDGYVYAFSATEEADMGLEAQTEIPFEEPQAITAIGGLVFIGTTKSAGSSLLDRVSRLWRARIGGDGNLSEFQLIRQWGSDIDPNSRLDSLYSDGESVYAGLADGQNWTGLWRYDLVSGGIVSHLLGSTSVSVGAVHNITIIGGHVFFAADNVYRDSDSDHVSSGYLITPAADFFTVLDKSWLRITVDAETPGDSSVVASYATDLDAMDDPNSSLWTQAGTVDSSSTDDEFTLTDARSRFIVLKIDLNASTDQTETPEVYSISVTANVIGEEVSITLPVNVSDRHERFGRRPVRRKTGTGKAMFQNLLDKRGKNVDLELYRHGLTVRGIVQEIQTPTQSITPRGSPTVYSLVTFRGTITNKS